MSDTLTVIIPTLNEEKDLRRCLESVTWADDIFVVDSFSTDRTLEIAREFTNHIVQHEYVNSATQKNWAMGHVVTDWVMVLDADEWVSPRLKARIQDILSRGTPHNGFYIRRMTYFFGRLIKHCGWHKDYLIRLWRNGTGRYEDLQVHADVLVEGSVGKLDDYILHETYADFDDLLEKFGRYTTWSSLDLHAQKRKAGWVNLTLRPMWRFVRMYVLRRGFLDGKHGLILCTIAACNVFFKYAKLWEKNNNAPAEKKGRQG